MNVPAVDLPEPLQSEDYIDYSRTPVELVPTKKKHQGLTRYELHRDGRLYAVWYSRKTTKEMREEIKRLNDRIKEK